MNETKAVTVDAKCVAKVAADWLDTHKFNPNGGFNDSHVMRATTDGSRVSLSIVDRSGNVLRFFADVTLDT